MLTVNNKAHMVTLDYTVQVPGAGRDGAPGFRYGMIWQERWWWGRLEASSPHYLAGGPVAVSFGSLTTHTVWRLSRSWSKKPLGAGASTASWVTSSLTGPARTTFPATSSTCSRRQAEFGSGSHPKTIPYHRYCRDVGGRQTGSRQYSLPLPILYPVFLSKVTWRPSHPAFPRPYSSHNLGICTATSHKTSRGQYILYFLSENWGLHAHSRLPHPQAASPASSPGHKGLPLGISGYLLEGGGLQVAGGRYLQPGGHLQAAGSS